MYCPQCGLAVDAATTRCPRCGASLSQSMASMPPHDTASTPPTPHSPEGGAGGEPQSYGAGSSPQLWGYAAPPTSPPPAPPTAYPPPPGYGYGAPPSGYGYGAPSYGQGAPPYGQSGPPSYPLYPGPGTTPGYVPGFPYAVPPAPFVRPRRRAFGWVIWSIVGVLALCVGSCGLLYVIGSRAPRGTVTPLGTTTAGQSLIYQNALAPSAPGFANDQHCSPKPDGLHVIGNYICYAPAGVLTDTNVSVTMKQTVGSTLIAYGIGFRALPGEAHYEFDINSNSKWVVLKCTRPASTCDHLVDFTGNSAIHGGLNSSNLLEVHMRGSHFDFYVNGTKVGQTDDTAYHSGKIGLTGTTNGEVVYTNLLITRPTN